MKKKLSGIIASTLLVGCHHEYTPDHSLKMAWTPALETTQPYQPPYGLLYNTDDQKQLIYVAAVFANLTKTNAIIEALIEELKPQVVLLQGHVGNNIFPSKVNFQLKSYRPPLIGASASRQQILKHLANYGISERDYEIFKVIVFMNQIWQFEEKSYEGVMRKALHHLKTDQNAKNLNLKIKDIKQWFYEKIGSPMTEPFIMDGELVAPKDPKLPITNYLQKISFYEDEIEDTVVMENLAKYLKEYDRVMVIRAASKYVTEKAVLQKMIGVYEPIILYK